MKCRNNSKRRPEDDRLDAVMRWFREKVTYEDEPYVMDAEQARAVMDESFNTIVVARAGSGKTRTIVAKIIYLMARRGVKADEIMAFVFNANAAVEINKRISKIRVNGVPLVVGETKIATTFHAFARKIVYEVCGGKEKCRRILAEEKELFIERIVQEAAFSETDEVEIMRLTGQMIQFVNRAQQKYLAGVETLDEVVRRYLKNRDLDDRRKKLVRMGMDVYRRYHWRLIGNGRKPAGFSQYGTDFNLLMTWASQLIREKRGDVSVMLSGKNTFW